MPDYSKTVIYKIQHVTNPDLLYVGCTTNFNARKNQHRSRYTNTNDKEHNAYKYKMIRENGGWDLFEMKPVKLVSCKSKLEAEVEEEKVRQDLRANLNKCIITQKRADKLFLGVKTRQYTAADLID